jgi:hypothetical protein
MAIRKAVNSLEECPTKITSGKEASCLPGTKL